MWRADVTVVLSRVATLICGAYVDKQFRRTGRFRLWSTSNESFSVPMIPLFRALLAAVATLTAVTGENARLSANRDICKGLRQFRLSFYTCRCM